MKVLTRQGRRRANLSLIWITGSKMAYLVVALAGRARCDDQ
jgi:hypothetical protein